MPAGQSVRTGLRAQCPRKEQAEALCLQQHGDRQISGAHWQPTEPSCSFSRDSVSITEGRGADKMAYHFKVLATNLTALEVVF